MNRFYVENGKIALNTYEIVVRQYSDLKKMNTLIRLVM